MFQLCLMVHHFINKECRNYGIWPGKYFPDFARKRDIGPQFENDIEHIHGIFFVSQLILPSIYYLLENFCSSSSYVPIFNAVTFPMAFKF